MHLRVSKNKTIRINQKGEFMKFFAAITVGYLLIGIIEAMP